MTEVLVFAERMLPTTQTFIQVQVNALRRFKARYVGLIPARPSAALNAPPILLTETRSLASRIKRELYRATGIAPRYHRRLKQTDAKLLHAHFAEGVSSAVAISSALHIPMIMHLRGGAELMPDRDLWRRAYQFPYLLWRKRAWRQATWFLCVSDYIRRKALASGFPEHKLRVHYTGIDFSRFSPSHNTADRDRNLVLYVGRLVPYKGADHLIRAMSIVRQTSPAAHLVVIGDGTFRNAVEELAVQLNIPAQFLGEQSPATIRQWLDRARVFCGPSITQPDGMSEAFGNVFTEAQAMGVPVVSYRHGGIPETMLEGHTGLLAEEGDHLDLANQLSRFLKEDDLWLRAHETGMQWVRDNFDVFKQTAKLESLYEEVIAAPGHNR